MFLILYMYIDMWDYVSVFWVFAYSRVEERYMSFFQLFSRNLRCMFWIPKPGAENILDTWNGKQHRSLLSCIYIYTSMYTFPNIGPGIIPFNISDPINMWNIFVG